MRKFSHFKWIALFSLEEHLEWINNLFMINPRKLEIVIGHILVVANDFLHYPSLL
jgi:hypothetical protein